MRTVTGLLYARPSRWGKEPHFRIVWNVPYTRDVMGDNDKATNQQLYFAKKDIEVELFQKKDLFLRRLFRLIKQKRI